MFFDRPQVVNEIYSKLLSDKLPANLGYLYENAVAQAIASKADRSEVIRFGQPQVLKRIWQEVF